jgi:archaellum component FlaC
MDSLSLLEQNLFRLLKQYQELQDQVRILKEENVRQRDEIVQSHAELQHLKQEYNHLQSAYALVAGNELNEEERQKAKQRLTAIINQIDKALETLKR